MSGSQDQGVVFCTAQITEMMGKAGGLSSLLGGGKSLDLEDYVTNKALATPGLVDLSHLGWGIDSWLGGDLGYALARVIDTDLTATFLLARESARVMVKPTLRAVNEISRVPG